MAYGKIKADAIIYDNNGSDVEKTLSSLAAAAPTASPTFTGTPAAPTAAQGTNTTQLATTAFVNAEIAADTTDKASLTSAQTFTALQTMNAGLAVDGPYKQTAEAVSALDIDLATGNYFTKTINGNSTFTFSNPPATGTVSSFTLELTHTSGTVAWPDGAGAAGIVRWPGDTPPNLTTGKTHLFVFVTDDGSVSSGNGPTYRGAFLADYVN